MILLAASTRFDLELWAGIRHPQAGVAPFLLRILEQLRVLFETVLKADEGSFSPRFATLHVPGQLPA